MLKPSYSSYHWCCVRECKNTTIKTPGKIWIRVPSIKYKKRRNLWLSLARRDPGSVSTATHMYICEDHFDLENDMENYMKYKIMGSVGRIMMKPDAVPSRFPWQVNRNHDVSPPSNNLHNVPSGHKNVSITSRNKNKLLASQNSTQDTGKYIDSPYPFDSETNFNIDNIKKQIHDDTGYNENTNKCIEDIKKEMDENTAVEGPSLCIEHIKLEPLKNEYDDDITIDENELTQNVRELNTECTTYILGF